MVNSGYGFESVGQGMYLFRGQEPKKPVSRRSVAVMGVLLTKRRQKMVLM